MKNHRIFAKTWFKVGGIALVLGVVLLAAVSLNLLAPASASQVPAAQATDVCGHITTETTWTVANSPYVVTCDVVVDAGVTLTIEPGVVVKFNGWYEDLWVNGTLVADGTSSDPITFTSIKDDAVGGDTNGDGSDSSPAPSDWNSLRFNSSSTGSVLDHVVVRYGGGQYAENIWVDTTDVTLTNNTIASAGGYGLYFDNVLPPTLSNNTFISNTNYAAYAALASNADSIALSGNTATGNGVNGFGVHGSIAGTVTWDGDDTLPFVVESDLTVNQGATLSLTPGTVVKFRDRYDDLWVKGTLMADTTADDPITFTSIKDDTVGGDTNGDGSASSPAPSDWSSLRFTSSSTGSVLDHAVVRYGGWEYYENVWVDTTDITLTNNTIAHSSYYGLTFDNALPPSLSNNTFISNTNYAVYAALTDNDDSITLSGNTASGNLVNGFGVAGSITGTVTWDGDDAFPFVVESDLTVKEGATFTLTPGTVVKFRDYYDDLRVNGTLIADTTDTDPIYFTSIKDDTVGGDTNGDGSTSSPAASDWSSLRFTSSSTGSVLDHAVVRYGGWEYYENVWVDTTDITLTNNTIAHSSYYGLTFDNALPPSLSNNTFISNTNYAVYAALTDNDDSITLSGNTASGNLVNGFGVAGSITGTVTWDGDDTFPFVVESDLTVNAGATLTLTPGTVVKFHDRYDDLRVSGTLIADTTADDPITFTSIKDDTVGGDTNGDGSTSSPAASDWSSLRFTSSSTGSVLDHAVVRYGGWEYYENVWVDTTDITLTNNTIAHSSYYGLTFDNALPPSLSNNTFISNTNYAVYAALTDNDDSITLSGNTASGNLVNGFGVAGSITGTVTWDGDDTFPFVVESDLTVNAGATLTLTPGTVVKFRDWYDDLRVNGTLIADTTASEPIYFTSIRDDTVGGDTNDDGNATLPAPNLWDSIRFSDTSRGSVLDHAVIRYGGGENPQNLHVATRDITITNSTIALAAGTGMVLENVLPAVLSNNTFISNTEYAAYVTLTNNDDSITLEGNTGQGNQLNGFVLEGTVSGEVIWDGDDNFPFVVYNDLTINENAQLTLTPGTIVKLYDLYDSIWVHGTLIADSEADAPIYFTAIRDDTVGGDTNDDGNATSPGPNHWDSIRFTETSTGSILNHTVIRYGSGQNPESVCVATSDITITNSTIALAFDSGIVLDKGSPIIEDNIIRDNHTGIETRNGSQATLRDNLIISNSTYGVYSGSGSQPTLRMNSILDNGQWGVYNADPAVTVDAILNWWGSPTGPYHATTNPDGEGDRVSDHVLYAPWLRKPVTGTVLVDELLLGLQGPATVSPGQTVAYAVSYANLTATTVENAVLMISLPRMCEYVDSTGGAIYWPERHHVFWRLGDLAPGGTGSLVARARFLWGLPDGLFDTAMAKLGGTNLSQDVLEVQPYLDYVPLEVTARVELTDAELLAERQAHPDFDAFFNQAVDTGLIFGLAERLAWSDGSTTTHAIFVQPDQHTVMLIGRLDEEVLASTYERATYTIQDASGGVTLDFSTGGLNFFGGWDPAQEGGVSVDATPSDEVPEETRFANCLTTYLTSESIEQMRLLVAQVTRGTNCWLCGKGRQIERSCPQCAAALNQRIGRDVLNQYRTTFCAFVVKADITAFICIQGDERFTVDPASVERQLLTGEDSCIFSRCSGLWPRSLWGSYARKICPSGKVCKPSKGCVPKNDTAARCEPKPTEGTDIDASAEATGTQAACDINDSTCEQARDPNEKYGPAGDLLPGQALTYTVACENVGAGTAYGVFIADELSEHLDTGSVTVYGEGGLIPDTNVLMWDIGELTPKGQVGSTDTVSFTVRLKDDLPSGTVIANEAVVYFPSVPEETPTDPVVNVIQPLVALPQSLEAESGQPIAITLQGIDVSGAPLTYTIVERPLFGEMTGLAPTLVYTPMASYVGLDYFTFQVSNGITESRAAEVSILVAPWPGDTTPPEVTWTYPEDGGQIAEVSATPVYTDADGPLYEPFILVEFSEVVSSTTVTTETMQVSYGGVQPVSVTVTYNGVFDQWMILPREPLRNGARYTVNVSQEVTDLMGNLMEADYTWSFSIGAPFNQIYLPVILKSYTQ